MNQTRHEQWAYRGRVPQALLPCLSPLLCILAYLSLGGVFDDSLIHSHITSHLHSFERGGVSSIELGYSILAVM